MAGILDYLLRPGLLAYRTPSAGLLAQASGQPDPAGYGAPVPLNQMPQVAPPRAPVAPPMPLTPPAAAPSTPAAVPSGGFQGWLRDNPTTAMGLGLGMMAGRNTAEGFANGLRGFMGGMTADQQMQDRRLKLGQAQAQREALNALLKDRNLDPATRAYLIANPEAAQSYVTDSLKSKSGATPYTDAAKAKADLDRGLITQEQYDQIISGSGGGPYKGTGMDAQSWNIILQGDPASPEYGAAYNQLFEQPKWNMVQTEQGMQLIPVMPTKPQWVKPPGDGAMPAAAATPGAMPGQAAAMSPESAASPQIGGSPVGQPVPIPGTQKPMTEQQRKGSVLVTSAQQDYERLTNPDPATGKVPFDSLSELSGQIGTTVGGLPGRAVQSPEYQVAVDSVRNIVQSYIYSVSGAQAPEQEVQRIMGLVLPLPTDTGQAIAAKKARLAAYMEAIRISADRGGPRETPSSPTPPSNTPAVNSTDPFGILQ